MLPGVQETHKASLIAENEQYESKLMPRYFSLPVFLLYCLAHYGLLLLGDHPFWDDWVLVDAPKDQILETFRQAGSFFDLSGYLHVYMLAVGPWFYRLATFILYYLTGYCFYVVLRRSRLLEKRVAFMAAVLFLVLPFNLGRCALILFPYTLCLFIFMLAWAILPKMRSLSLFFFFVSFNTNSLLVFYLLPLIEDYKVFIQKFWPGAHLPGYSLFVNLRQYVFTRPFTVALPLLYYIPKLIFFRPYGFYSGYNENFSFFNLLRAPAYHLRGWVGSVLRGDIPSILMLFLSTGLIFLCFRYCKSWLNNNFALKAGLFAVFLGLFPYYILGHVPSFTGWTSRHQLLIPFGLSLLVAHGLGTIRTKELSKKVPVLVVALLVISCAFNWTSFRADALKQQAIQKFMANSLDTSRPGLVVVEDRTANALQRAYAFYEINGMLARAVKAQSFFGILSGQIVDYANGRYDQYFSAYYNAGQHQRESSADMKVILIDSTSPLKQVYPFELHACSFDFPFSTSLPMSRLECPPEGRVRLY